MIQKIEKDEKRKESEEKESTDKVNEWVGEHLWLQQCSGRDGLGVWSRQVLQSLCVVIFLFKFVCPLFPPIATCCIPAEEVETARAHVGEFG